MGAAQGKEFPFELQEVNTYFQSKSHWKLHSAAKKADRSSVSIFFFDGKVQSNLLPLATNCFKRFRTLRHPNLLSFIDGVEVAETFNIVTEKVNPLGEVLPDLKKFPNSIFYGLYQIANGLSFIHSVKLTHGYVQLDNIFVNKAGDWKLGGFDLLGDIKDSTSTLRNNSIVSAQYKSPELLQSNWQILSESPPSATDSWMFACLIYEIYNGPLIKTEDLKKVGLIPKDLLPIYQKLLLSNPSSRSELSKVIENAIFTENNYVADCIFLDNIALKDNFEKDKFFKKLVTSLDDFPEAYAKYKILPHLVTSLDFGGANPRVLEPLLKIGKLLSETEYNEHITPSVVKWFANPDRGLRMNLLQNMDFFVEHLNQNIIENQIFPNIATGFGDSTPALREATVKSLILLVPKMSPKLIGNEVMNYLAKLQTDEEPGIRTNTTICIAKISSYLSKDTRPKILVSALCKALRDPYPKARVAGLVSLMATENIYDKIDTATKILPFVIPLTIDPDKEVRDNSFKTVNLFIEKLQKISESGDEVASDTSSKPNESGMLGWALGTITKKIIGGEQNSQNNASNQSNNQSMNSQKEISPALTPSNSQSNISNQSKPSQSQSTTKTPTLSTKPAKENGWEDDFEFDNEFEKEKEKPKPSIITHTSSSSNITKKSEPKTNIFASPKSTPASPSNSTTKAQVEKKEEDKGGWETDNWNDDDEGWNFKVDDFKPAMKEEKPKNSKKD